MRLAITMEEEEPESKAAMTVATDTVVKAAFHTTVKAKVFTKIQTTVKHFTDVLIMALEVH